MLNALRTKARSALLGIVIAIGAAAASLASPLEDGLAAYNRGDYVTAVEYWRPIAQQGDAGAQYNLGIVYELGQGVLQDNVEAANWYRKAAEQGIAAAQFNLAIRYQVGQGVTQSYVEAARWFSKAADQGVATAQFNLGVLYAHGQGVMQDYVEAVKWYRKAAEQGQVDAQSNLGFMYLNGRGVPKDYVQAHKWLNIAAANYPDSDADRRKKTFYSRDAVAAKMTPAQIAEAQRLAREWKPAMD
jgi:TPR repeat protein